jgi:regulatory protein
MRIERVESFGRDGKARRLVLADCTDRLTSSYALKISGLLEGDELDDTVLGEAEEVALRERALRLVGYRERSVGELRDRLLADGFPALMVTEIVTSFERSLLVDDVRFAASFVRSRTMNGFGRQRIERELSLKRVNPEVIATAFDAGECDEEIVRARRVLGDRIAVDRRDRERLIRKLVRRGFSLSVARTAVDAPSGSNDG